jgi:tetratricopeptide (TPR) repeat protein
MKSLPLACGALGACLIAAQAPAHTISLGSSLAETCYKLAKAKANDQSAIAQCTAALNEPGLMQSDRVATHVNRGIVLMLADRSAEAIRDFDTAVALDANEPEAYLNKGLTHLRTGNARAALPLATRALQLHTRRPAIAYYVRGLAAEDQGDVKSAYADLRRAAAIDPKWSEPLIELQRYRVR